MKYIFSLSLMFVCFSAFNQVAKDQVLEITVDAGEDNLTLQWEHTEGFTGSYTILKKSSFEADWQQIASVNAPATNYIDNETEKGRAYEYAISKIQGANAVALGYIYAGFEKEAFAERGEVIVLIDSSFIETLKSELDRYISDLEMEGWNTNVIYAGREEAVVDVKDRIVSAASEQTTALTIIGHVPVPYSGNFTTFGIIPPDGHIEGSGNHTGAWAADAYYGDLDGSWTDNSTNHTDARLDRGDNVPGDGKFDQTKLPTEVELQIGRIDFWEMTEFEKTEEELLKDYLDRNHSYRTGEWKVRERALIDNNFTGFNLASTGYHNFSTFLNADSIDATADYIVAQREGSYLWSYGCGAGSFTSCNGLNDGKRATTADIAADTLHNVFTIIAGSYFGDWDIANNFLRAPLCNNSLISFWGGLPKWYVHHMAMGLNVGYGAKISTNNDTEYFNGQFNNAQKSIHIALMGDPTLVMKGLPQPSNLEAISANGDVELTWTEAQGEFDGYNIYIVDENNSYKKVNENPVTGNTYVDNENYFSGDYMYSVRCVKLEENPSGSYFNIGGGPKAEVSHINGFGGDSQIEFSIYPSPVNENLNIQTRWSKELSVQVYDLNGRVLISERLFNKNTIDVSSLQKGVYLISVTNDFGATAIEQFVKI